MEIRELKVAERTNSTTRPILLNRIVGLNKLGALRRALLQSRQQLAVRASYAYLV